MTILKSVKHTLSLPYMIAHEEWVIPWEMLGLRPLLSFAMLCKFHFKNKENNLHCLAIPGSQRLQAAGNKSGMHLPVTDHQD